MSGSWKGSGGIYNDIFGTQQQHKPVSLQQENIMSRYSQKANFTLHRCSYSIQKSVLVHPGCKLLKSTFVLIIINVTSKYVGSHWWKKSRFFRYCSYYTPVSHSLWSASQQKSSGLFGIVIIIVQIEQRVSCPLKGSLKDSNSSRPHIILILMSLSFTVKLRASVDFKTSE